MGILDWFGGSNAQQQRMDNPGTGKSQPGGVYDPSTYGILGPQARQPLSDEQRRSILFSAIADSFDSVRGINSNTTGQLSDQFRQDNAKQQADKRRAAINSAIQTAISQGNMQQARALIMQAAPDDVSHITNALTFGQPKISNSPEGDNVYSTDPLTGVRTQIQTGAPKPVNHNQPFNADGTPNLPYQTYQKSLIADRKTPKAANPNAAVFIPHPSAGY